MKEFDHLLKTRILKAFIDENFLLQNNTARQLYHEVAAGLPVVDYHNHLQPVHLATNHQFGNLTDLWVAPDQYKHRAMRIHGIPEAGITGDAPSKDKFLNWANTFPKTVGNPLFHWSCLELKRIFDIDAMLNEKNAEDIWRQCNARLREEELSTIGLLRKWKVEVLCTSDDLLDDLQPHITATQKYGIKVWPSLRGDSIIEVRRSGYPDWLAGLSRQTDTHIRNLEDYQVAIRQKLDDFRQANCQFVDHALNAGFQWENTSYTTAAPLFQKQLSGARLDPAEYRALQSYLLVFLGKEYAARNWALQLHIGAQRRTSSRLSQLAGSAGGYAAIGQGADIAGLTRFLDALEQEQSLPRIILYTLNPNDNEAFASLTGSFAEDGVPGKIQFGPAWWYNDHYEGLRQQLVTLANYGLLYHFIGMTTDSRSLLSFSRHEYFRRVLCNLLGKWVELGHLPADWALLQSTLTAICYGNIKSWITEKETIHATETIER